MSVFSPIEKPYWLHQVCELNYDKLTRLIHDWAALTDSLTGHAESKPPLNFKLLERSPYTLVIELTHSPVTADESEPDPQVRIRICLDAKTAEVLSGGRYPPAQPEHQKTLDAERIVDRKWQHNYFLSRWLDHCLRSHYRFQHDRPPTAIEPVP